MHGSVERVDSFAAGWREAPAGVDVVFCPPWAYLAQAAAALRGSLRLGVQNVAVAPAGAFTGEHAAEMARDLGAAFAIVGHSERRHLFGETDALVARKFQAAQRAGLTPILCVGETLAQRRRGEAETVVRAQLDAVRTRCGPLAFAAAVIAYEPVWAIGTGETAAPEQAQAMHRAIRERLASEDEALAATVRIVYGGSVKATNAEALFAAPDIDGGLVGGASLDAAEFAAICAAAAPTVLGHTDLGHARNSSYGTNGGFPTNR